MTHSDERWYTHMRRLKNTHNILHISSNLINTNIYVQLNEYQHKMYDISIAVSSFRQGKRLTLITAHISKNTLSCVIAII